MCREQFVIPRILIGATASGGGKTTITCGILKALKNRGKKVGAFKCGPDYIDPMFHSRVIGVPSRNLDLFFNDEDTIKYLLHKNTVKYNCDIAVIEGVMGYYDGVAGKTSIAGAYDLARATDTPTVLIVDCKGKSLSVVAEIKGFLSYVEDSKIKGVILNKASASMYNLLAPIIEKQLKIKTFGFVPLMENAAFESRHLGLVTASEIENIEEIIENIASQIEDTVDVDGLLKLADSAPAISYTYEEIKGQCNKEEAIKIAVAMDDAFCFYYEDNLDLLEKLGCEIVPFSPLKSKSLPEEIGGIILGGGYPELYLKELSFNKSLMAEIKMAIESGIPLLAECGGFMYLHQWILDKQGNKYDMVGAINGGSYPLEKLGRFGYIDLSLNNDTPFLKKGEMLKGHEFHYWDSENPGNIAHAKKPLAKKNWECMISYKGLLAGYPHINYYSNLNLPKGFVKKSREYRETI